MSTHPSSSLSTALAAIRGTVVLAGEPGYDEARLPWNLAVDQRPAAIVTPVDESDLQAVVRVARDAGVQATAQPTGHGAGSALEGAILVRTSAFDLLDVDVDRRVATVGAGVRVGALMAALDGTGLVGPTGTSRTVGVAGFTLGGGQGWLSRLGGLGGQWVRRVRLVDGSGEARWIDDDDPAMAVVRGAGGLLGVVTTIELDLVPVTSLVGGSLRFAATDAAAVLQAMRGLEAAPAGLGLSGVSVRMPNAPMLPEAIRGRSWFEAQVVLADVGPGVLDALREAAPVLDASLRPVQPSELATITNDPEAPGVSLGWAATLPSLDAAIDPLMGFHASDAAAPIIGVDVRLTAGIPRARPAVARLDAPWLVHGIAPVMGGDGAAQRAALAAIGDAMAPVSSTTVIPTFLGIDGTLARALDADALDASRVQHDRLGAGTIMPWRLP